MFRLILIAIFCVLACLVCAPPAEAGPLWNAWKNHRDRVQDRRDERAGEGLRIFKIRPFRLLGRGC